MLCKFVQTCSAAMAWHLWTEPTCLLQNVPVADVKLTGDCDCPAALCFCPKLTVMLSKLVQMSSAIMAWHLWKDPTRLLQDVPVADVKWTVDRISPAAHCFYWTCTVMESKFAQTFCAAQVCHSWTEFAYFLLDVPVADVKSAVDHAASGFEKLLRRVDARTQRGYCFSLRTG